MLRRPNVSLIAQQRTSRRTVVLSLIAALGLQAAIVFALITGLTPQRLFVASSELVVEILDETKPLPASPAPLPPTILAAPQLPAAPLPEIRIQASSPPEHSISTVAHATPTISAGQASAPAPVAPAVPTQLAVIGVRAVPGTHTAPPYPEVARRLAEQGTVTVRIEIAASGTVKNVAVLRSSGSERLDAAAVSWIKAHWKYHAASRGGVAVESHVEAQIVFDLRNS